MLKSSESECVWSVKVIVPVTKMIDMNWIDERVVFVLRTLRDDVHSQNKQMSSENKMFFTHE